MTEVEASAEKKFQFEENERVLCYHGPLLYEAKVLEKQWMEEGTEHPGSHYLIHYKGWKQTWDEWVPETRVVRWNEPNLKMQRQLKDLYNVQKTSRGSSASASDSSGPELYKGLKRNRGSSLEKEEDYLNTPEIRLDMPDTLKGQLVDDWESVTKNQQLVTLPRDPTINEILENYRVYKKEKKNGREITEELLEEVIQGVRIYFNKALGNMLLYRFERHQYAETRKTYPQKEMVDIYGAEHLLRLFVQMPALIAHTEMDSDGVIVLIECLTDILKQVLVLKTKPC
ncbi:MRG-domain-containing protein [Phycomyces nitens]|nr:MRG-domain-containing protein [Phycomyces nitens]